MANTRIVKSKSAPDSHGFIIHSIPASKPLAVKTIIRDGWGRTLAIDDKGKIYSPSLGHSHIYSENSSISVKVVTLLAKMGVITQAQADDHAKARDAYEHRQRAKYALNELIETSDKYGLKIAKSQLAKLRKLAGVE